MVVDAQDTWRYFVGNAEPPGNWFTTGFNDQAWQQGKGGFGYDDNDDNTIIPPAYSVYLRKEFNLTDTAVIEAITLCADYDDAFVAYLNGVEIARTNITSMQQRPRFNDTATTPREAKMYQGKKPELYTLDKKDWQQQLKLGNNLLTVQVHNVSFSSSDMSALFFLMIGSSDNVSRYRPPPSWFPKPLTSSNLPLLIINTSGTAIPDEPKIKATLGIIDNGKGNRNKVTDPFTTYDGRIAIETRGSSSQKFPKKNYGFETRLQNDSNNNVLLLGLPRENDWIVHGPYSDKTLMRNVLAYHIGESTGEYTPRTRWCELIINGNYEGLYVLTEKIKRDKYRVNIDELTPDAVSGLGITGGYIFSVDRNDAGPGTGWESPYAPKPFYRYREPNADELVPAKKTYLQDYVTLFEQTMENDPNTDKYNDFIDVDSWVNYWLATEVFKHIDNFKFSFYMHKHRSDKGGKIHFGPLWDLNLAFGNYDFGQNPDPNNWSYVWAKQKILRPHWVVALSENPEIQSKIKCRWKELRSDSWSTENLMRFIDQNAVQIEEARVRNFERWDILGKYVWPNDFVGNTYEEELNHLKTWLTNRLTWLDENMFGTCTEIKPPVSVSEPVSNKDILLYPNPIKNELTVYFKNAMINTPSVRIHNTMGKEVLKEDLSTFSINKLDVASLTTGVYHYQIFEDQKLIKTGKLIKE